VGQTDGSRACPGCGATVDTQYCPHCGSRAIPADEPVWSGQHRSAELESPTVPSLPVVQQADQPARAVPEMFQTEMVQTAPAGPTEAWSQAPESRLDPAGPPSGLFPGWTGMYPAVATAGAHGALAPRQERRRKAIYAVAGIAAATVLVLLAALLIAPHLGRTNDVADKDGQPVAISAVPDSRVSASAAPQSDGHPSTQGDPTTSTAAAPAPAAPTTVTVTASGPAAPATSGGKATAAVKPAPKPVKTTAKKPAPTKPVPKKPAAKPKPSLGVPQHEIACSGGYIVQLASELDAPTLAAHVARLKASGQLPAGALAADSAHSCDLFSSQSNTVVLYAGPFASRYAGCAARLAGPADAYIKGGNPATATEYVSCLCPANAAGLPRLATIGQQNVWVGELQRVLGNRLNIDVNDLSGHWGTFTPGTKAAVQQFQKSRKLPATGGVDARTWKTLQSAGC
jgi:hypothetical protein